MRSTRSNSLSIVAILAISVGLVLPAVAEIAPLYRTWQDFGAVVSQSSIPGLLGDVDRIERTPKGTYIVRAGACSVEITVNRESSIAPSASRVGRVDIGAKHCN